MYKAIIFDFDYTLGDSSMGIVESVNYALHMLGYETESTDNIKKTIGLSLAETFKTLTGIQSPDTAAEFASLFKEKADSVMVDNTTLYPHTLDFLTRLKETGIKTAIVTTKFHYRIDAILAKFNATKLVDAVIGGEDVSAAKPHPEGLLSAIHKLNIPKEHVLYVGDSIVDAKTACSAGVDFAAVITGTTTQEEFNTLPNVVLGKDLGEIMDYVMDTFKPDMTEQEKADLGLLYDCNSKELLDARTHCKDMCYVYNNCPPSDTKARQQLIYHILGSAGANVNITAPFWCDYGYNISVGENFYTNHNCVILDCTKVTIGDNVLLGPNCCISAAGHPLDVAQRVSGLEYAHPITIGNNVWLGASVTVLPGVTIGDNTVIGAGSVVTKDIPANVVAVGNPCRVLRPITEEDKEKYR